MPQVADLLIKYLGQSGSQASLNQFDSIFTFLPRICKPVTYCYSLNVFRKQKLFFFLLWFDATIKKIN